MRRTRRSLARIASSPSSSTPTRIPGSEEKFKEISVAYDVLGDADKRKEYDEVRRLGPAAAGFGGPARRAPGGFNFQTGDLGDLGDLFGGLFGGRRQRAQRGADLETALHLSFRDAVMGVTTTVSLPSSEACHTCRGRGAAPGGLRDLRVLQRSRRLQRRPGPLRDVERLSGLSGSRWSHRDAVSDLSRHRARAVLATRQRAHPAGRRRRSTHPTQGQGRPRQPRGTAGRPLRRRARRARRAFRSSGSPRHHDRQRAAHLGASSAPPSRWRRSTSR